MCSLGTRIALDLAITSLDEVAVVSKLDSHFLVQQQALTLRADRQQVLAANIANADTPHYQARDYDFAVALQNALGGRVDGSLPLASTAPRHLPGNTGTGAERLLYRQAAQPSADGNTVDMDLERAQFAANAFYYEAGLSFITSQIRTMTAALQGP